MPSPAALDVTVYLDARWDDGNVDRLIDRAHASIVEHVVGTLRRAGWEVLVEYGFNHYGDRGSVDVLAWYEESRTLLIVEVKSILTDLQATFTSFARKLRIVPDSFAVNWLGRTVLGRLWSCPAQRPIARIVANHAATFATLFPERMPAIGRGCGGPIGPWRRLVRLKSRGANAYRRSEPQMTANRPARVRALSRSHVRHANLVHRPRA